MKVLFAFFFLALIIAVTSCNNDNEVKPAYTVEHTLDNIHFDLPEAPKVDHQTIINFYVTGRITVMYSFYEDNHLVGDVYVIEDGEVVDQYRTTVSIWQEHDINVVRWNEPYYKH